MTAAVTPAARCRIALDAMGGDNAPDEIVKGALLAIEEYPVDILLVGKEEVLREKLAALGSPSPRNLEIVDAREVVEMDDTALAPLRRKRNSSIRVCANLIAEKRAQAMVSAGHTGASMTSAYKVLGTIEGVSRPALAAIVPSSHGHTVLLDVGANVDSKPAYLREFAVMGHFYAQMVFGVAEPRVGLLSIGEEEGKGNELTKETFRVMKETGLNFVGNAEGRDVYNGNCDVVVCDGFTGNVVLKTSEGFVELIEAELSSAFTTRIGSLLTRRALRHFHRRVDYAEYGGAPLLGVAGVAVVGHGRSNAKAVRNAVAMAYRFAAQRVIERIERDIAAAAVSHP
ncbi:MAG TPA: phosphate acyltransferase PlsX [Thermoanaerobaculia bacterium]|nr:phosphate acyltransferase PlsX [Thermoanaerobaculia bacterium]